MREENGCLVVKGGASGAMQVTMGGGNGTRGWGPAEALLLAGAEWVAVILKAGELPFRGEVHGEGRTCYSDRLQSGRERGVRLEAYGGHPVPVPISDALWSPQSVS